MKKISTSILTLLMVFTLASVSYAAPHKNIETTSTPIESSKADLLLLRLDEINAMDKSDLKSVEKRALRNEVKSIEKSLNSGGVYLSVGALIVIILLLILLL